MEGAYTFTCQSCRARLTLVGPVEAAPGTDSTWPITRGLPGQLQASVFDNASVDESFIVLDGKRQGASVGSHPGSGQAGGPPALRAGPSRTALEAGPALGTTTTSTTRQSPPQPVPLPQQQQQQQQLMQARGLEESFVMLGAASALAQLFELASTNTQVDHPLCMDCVGQLKEEMEAQVRSAWDRCRTLAWACTLGNVRTLIPTQGAGADEEYYVLEEISRLEQERDQERARAEVLGSELAAVAAELSSLAAASADLDSLEERYWHDVADFELLLRAHTDERGALLAKIDRAGQRLQLLKNTSVLYDAFKIWHDGPFGTISGFRLGRTPEVPVEWDEVNAAWGQAVLLLHTMAQMVKLQFSQYRLMPMGSHPRVADKRATYDLFGPVSKLWSANYDRAMTAYLACLREFGEFARRKDLQDGKVMPFNFPFAIDGDKVNNATIKLTLNKDARWTKALKFMLANLKIALQWTVKQDQAGDAPPLPHLAQEGPQLLPEL
eukprot:XP_001689505.1 autophagy protein [Chlamydomonas reinhardtii]